MKGIMEDTDSKGRQAATNYWNSLEDGEVNTRFNELLKQAKQVRFKPDFGFLFEFCSPRARAHIVRKWPHVFCENRAFLLEAKRPQTFFDGVCRTVGRFARPAG
jgi:hypothetical protein